MKLLVLVVLVGCQQSTPTPVPGPPPSSAPRDAEGIRMDGPTVPPTVPLAPPSGPSVDPATLTVVLPSVPAEGGKVVGNPVTFQRCTIANSVALVENGTGGPWCKLSITSDTKTAISTFSDCPKRTTDFKAQCTGGKLEIRYTITDANIARSVPIVCDKSDELRCKRSPDLTAADPKLRELLDRVKRDVEGHRWKNLLAECAADHRHQQLDKTKDWEGMQVPEYLAEIMGIHMSENSIAESVQLSDLDKITRIDFVEVGKLESPEGWFQIGGIVTVRGGGQLYLVLDAVKQGDRYWLTGAVG